MTNELYCDLCGGDEFEQLIELKQKVILPGSVIRCHNCHMMLKIPLPDKETLEKLYGIDYARHPYFCNRQSHINEDLDLLILEIKNQLSGNGARSFRLLDIGCGAGELLVKARQAGFETVGVEPCMHFVKILETGNHEHIPELFENVTLPGNSFDVVCMMEVLEHVTSPGLVLSRAKALLRKNALLLLKIPNYASSIVKMSWVLRRFGLGYLKSTPIDILFGEYHTYFFTPAIMKAYLRKYGFDPVLIQYKRYCPEWSNQVRGILKMGVHILSEMDKIMKTGFYMTVLARKTG